MAWQGEGLPDKSWGFIFLGAVVWAGFLAWREQYRRKPNLEVTGKIRRLIQLKETATRDILNATPPSGLFELVNFFISEQTQAGRRWQDEVVTTLPRAGATEGEVSRFTTLGTFEPIGGVTPEYARFRGMLAERLKRLDELIRTLEQRNTAPLP